MNLQNPNGEDEDLPGLRRWQVKVPLPPRFQENVWRRIEAGESRDRVSFWQGWMNWYDGLTARPGLALAYAMVFLAAGAAAGFLHGRQTTAWMNDALETRYVQSVDPYQPRN